MRAKLVELLENMARNGKVYRTLVLRSMEEGDVKLNVFDENLILEVGKTYEYTTKQNGKWTNIDSISEAEGSAAPETNQRTLSIPASEPLPMSRIKTIDIKALMKNLEDMHAELHRILGELAVMETI